MAQLNVIVISEVHGGVINRVKAFSNDEEGEQQAKAFVVELLGECVDEDDHEECLHCIEEQGGFSFGELDVVKDYTH